MALPAWQYLQGSPFFEPTEPTFIVFGDGDLVANAAAQKVMLVEDGMRVVLSGTFSVSGGDVVGGTVTGFDTWMGNVRLLHATGYSISWATFADALEQYQMGSPDAFISLLTDELKQIGSSGDDSMFGANIKGVMLGMGGNDRIYGDIGNEVMRGGAGNDFLSAGAGVDQMFGGPGRDVFVFGDNFDRIRDFNPAQDVVALEWGLVPELQPGFLKASTFHVGAGATTLNHHIIYNPQNGRLYHDPDGNQPGGDPKEWIGTLQKHLNLHANDFIVGMFVA